MAVNAMAHFWTCKSFLPAMMEANDGHLVTVSSAAGIFASPKLVVYGASKCAASVCAARTSRAAPAPPQPKL